MAQNQMTIDFKGMTDNQKLFVSKLIQENQLLHKRLKTSMICFLDVDILIKKFDLVKKGSLFYNDFYNYFQNAFKKKYLDIYEVEDGHEKQQS